MPSDYASLDSLDMLDYGEPEMMAIGDSIFNGTRSLSTTPNTTRYSVPALVAKGLKIRQFRAPKYPRPVLFDLEEHLREGFRTDHLRREALKNAERWLDCDGVFSETRFFDNIAIAGAEFQSFYTDVSGSLRKQSEKHYSELKSSQNPNYYHIYKLYYAINAAFLLNPSGHPGLDELSPLEQVALRRPKRLLINIGSNEGLFRTALTASFTPEHSKRMRKIPGQAKRLGDFLAKRCGNIDHIYFNLLVRPRTLANLAPRTDKELFAGPQEEDYFRSYVGRLFSLGGINKDTMKKLDELVATTNEKSSKILRDKLGERVHFVDLYRFSESYDRKHGDEKQALWVRGGDSKHRLSNYPFSTMLFFGGFRHGGLFGLDNLHPTLPGYGLLANEIGAKIASVENVKFSKLRIQRLFEEDSLLQSPPGNWDLLMLVASFADLQVGFDDSS